MKSMFVLVFAFSLGVLAPLAKETPEFNQADTTHDTASLGSRNLDSLDAQDRFLSRKKREQINSCTDLFLKWAKFKSHQIHGVNNTFIKFGWSRGSAPSERKLGLANFATTIQIKLKKSQPKSIF